MLLLWDLDDDDFYVPDPRDASPLGHALGRGRIDVNSGVEHNPEIARECHKAQGLG